MRLILHIGLPKTATTSVQARLSGVRPILARAGLCFPGNSVWHHEIVRGLQAVEAGRTAQQYLVDDLLTGFAAEARKQGAGQVLISCEGLSTAAPGTVLRLRDALRLRFPRLREVMVLCYVREPVSFAASLCQQAVKAGAQRLAAFHDDPWQVNLRQMLQSYAKAFGRESLCLRVFDPAHLAGGDVMTDLLDAIGLAGLDLPGTTPVLNPALSAEGVQVADALAAIRPRGRRQRFRRRHYKRLLEEIGGSRFLLPARVQDLVIERSAADMAALKADFGLTILPRRVPAPDHLPLPPELAEAMAREIEQRVEGVARPRGRA